MIEPKECPVCRGEVEAYYGDPEAVYFDQAGRAHMGGVTGYHCKKNRHRMIVPGVAPKKGRKP